MISAVVLTKNNQDQIVNCLESLSWCNEILIIDDKSLDETTELAKKHGAKVVVHSLDNNFAQQRNFGLEHAKEDWVLFVDADEVVSEHLQKEIQSVINSQNLYQGFLIKRTDSMWGKKLQYGETANVNLLRLAKKSSGKWMGAVHEVWKINGKIGQLENPIFHYPHQSVKDFLSEINFYSTLRSTELFNQKAKANFFSIIAYPKAKFFVNYVLKSGYKDGIPGLVVALMMSFHSFLVRAKLWQLWQQEKTYS